MSKRSHIRRRQDSDDEDSNQPFEQEIDGNNSNDGSDGGNVIEDIKLIQKLRQRKNGLSAAELSQGRAQLPSSASNTVDLSDPFNLKAGGLIEMSSFKDSQRSRSEKDIASIKNTFARETNTRDEDTEMQRYIEEQLARIQQKPSITNNTSSSTGNDDMQTVLATLRKPEDTLFHVSKHLITDSSSHASEEMLSDQMLSGIPEVDIGVEEKIRNIEETDKAKRKLLQTICDKKGTEKKVSTAPSQSSAPMNLLASVTAVPATPTKTASVSFVQHKRFNTDSMDLLNSKRFRHHHHQHQIKDVVKPQPVVGNKEKHPTLQRDFKSTSTSDKPLSETATDDLLFDQFRKNLHGSRNWKIRHA